MRWEIVARKPGDKKDTRFEVKANTSAEAVAEAMSWGWTIRSFRAIERPAHPGAIPDPFQTAQIMSATPQKSLAIWAVAGFVMVLGLAAGAFVLLKPTSAPTVASPPSAAPRASVAAEPAPVTQSQQSPAPSAVAPAPVMSAAPLAEVKVEPVPPEPSASAPPAAARAAAPARNPGNSTELLRPAIKVGVEQIQYVASRSAVPFHLPSCSSAGRISTNNLESFNSREAAINAGHSPCKVCNP